MIQQSYSLLRSKPKTKTNPKFVRLLGAAMVTVSGPGG